MSDSKLSLCNISWPCWLYRSKAVEVSCRISMSKHSTAMIHGHSTLKKSTSIPHMVLLHFCLYRGKYLHNLLLSDSFLQLPHAPKTRQSNVFTWACFVSLFLRNDTSMWTQAPRLHRREISVTVAPTQDVALLSTECQPGSRKAG